MSASTSSRKIALAALLAALSGCTLIMQGTSQVVEFNSDPAGAEFTVGGQTYTTPRKVDLPKEDQQVTFHKSGYYPEPVELKRRISIYFYGSLVMGLITSAIDLSTGAYKEFETTDVRVVMRPLPGTAKEFPVLVTSEPPGADILVADVNYGRAPKELRLAWLPADREKSVTLRLAGHDQKIVPLGRDQRKLDVVLTPLPELVPVRFVSTPPGAEVFVDGLRAGQTPVSYNVSYKSRAARVPVELSLEGYRPVKREVTFAERDVTVALEEIVEEIPLPVKVEPKGAKIAVDGVPVAEAPANVKLSWSITRTRHTLTVTHPGYATQTVEVKRAEAAKPLQLKLSPAIP